MLSCGQVFDNFASYPGAEFFCRVVDKESGFDIELFDIATEKAW